MRIRRPETARLRFWSDNREMEDRASRFLSHNRILGSLVGAYYSLALVVLCFNFGLLRPLVAPNLSSRAEEFLLAARQAGVLIALGTIAGVDGHIPNGSRKRCFVERARAGRSTGLDFLLCLELDHRHSKCRCRPMLREQNLAART